MPLLQILQPLGTIASAVKTVLEDDDKKKNLLVPDIPPSPAVTLKADQRKTIFDPPPQAEPAPAFSEHKIEAAPTGDTKAGLPLKYRIQNLIEAKPGDTNWAIQQEKYREAWERQKKGFSRSAFEQGIKDFGNAIPLFVERAKKTIPTLMRAAYEQIYPNIGQKVWYGGAKPPVGAEARTGDEFSNRVYNWTLESIKDISKREKEISEKIENKTIAAAASGIASMAAAGAVFALTKNPKAAAGFLSVLESSDSYNDARDAGKSPFEALKLAAAEGVGTYFLEGKSLEFMFGTKAGRSVIASVSQKSLVEGAQEVTQTVWQNGVAKHGYDEMRGYLDGWYESLIGGMAGGGFASTVQIAAESGAFNRVAEDVKNKLGISSREAERFVDDLEKSVQAGVDRMRNFEPAEVPGGVERAVDKKREELGMESTAVENATNRARRRLGLPTPQEAVSKPALRDLMLLAQDTPSAAEFVSQALKMPNLPEAVAQNPEAFYEMANSPRSQFLTMEEAASVVDEFASHLGVSTEFVDRLTTPEGKTAFGQFVDEANKILIVRNPRGVTGPRTIDPTTPYHEVGHAAFNHLFTEEERQEILQEAMEKYKDDPRVRNIRDAEERMVQDFKKYADTRQTSNDRYGRFIAAFVRFVKKVANFITGTGKVEDFYEKIITRKKPSERAKIQRRDRQKNFRDTQRKYYQTPDELTSKFFKHKEIVGKEFVSYNAVQNALKGAGLKEAELQIISGVLDTQFKDQKRISVKEFEKAVHGELLPLDIIAAHEDEGYANYGAEAVDKTDLVHSTHVFNTEFEHGVVGHFTGLFTEEISRDEVEIVQVPTRSDFAIIKKGVELTADNVAESTYGVFPTREAANAWLDKRSTPIPPRAQEISRTSQVTSMEVPEISVKVGPNEGMFAHSRVWTEKQYRDDDKGIPFKEIGEVRYVAELQSDVFQKKGVEELTPKWKEMNGYKQLKNLRLNEIKELKTKSHDENQTKLSIEKYSGDEQVKKSLAKFIKINQDRGSVSESEFIDESEKFKGGQNSPEYNAFRFLAFFSRGLKAKTPATVTKAAIKKQDEKIKGFEKRIAELGEEIEVLNKEYAKAKKTEEYQALAPYRNIWHERLIREEIRVAAIDGVRKLRFPMPRTVAAIESYGGVDTESSAPYTFDGDQERNLIMGDVIKYLEKDYIVLQAIEGRIKVAPDDEVGSWSLDEFLDDSAERRWNLIKNKLEEWKISNSKDATEMLTKAQGVESGAINKIALQKISELDSKKINLDDIKEDIIFYIKGEEYEQSPQILESRFEEVYYSEDNELVFTVDNIENVETLRQPNSYNKESGDAWSIEDYEDEQRTVLEFYDKKIKRYLEKSRKGNLQVITDDEGFEWLETEIQPEDAAAVEAFQTEDFMEEYMPEEPDETPEEFEKRYQEEADQLPADQKAEVAEDAAEAKEILDSISGLVAEAQSVSDPVRQATLLQLIFNFEEELNARGEEMPNDLAERIAELQDEARSVELQQAAAEAEASENKEDFIRGLENIIRTSIMPAFGRGRSAMNRIATSDAPSLLKILSDKKQLGYLTEKEKIALEELSGYERSVREYFNLEGDEANELAGELWTEATEMAGERYSETSRALSPETLEARRTTRDMASLAKRSSARKKAETARLKKMALRLSEMAERRQRYSAQTKVKERIRKLTGQKDTGQEIKITERGLLRLKLAAERRGATLGERLGRVDTRKKIMEQVKKRKSRTTLIERIARELRATKVKKQGGKPVGRFTPEIQNVLDKMREAVKMSKEDAEKIIQANLERYKDTAPPEEIGMQNRILSLAAGVKEKSIEELQTLLVVIKETKATGRMARELAAFNRSEDVDRWREKAVEIITGGEGIKAGTATTGVQKAKGVRAFFDTLGKNFVGFDDIMDMLATKDKTTDPGMSWLNQFADTLQEEKIESEGQLKATRKLKEMFAESYDIKSDRKVEKKMRDDTKPINLGTFKNAEGAEVEIELTRAELRKRWMELQDPTLEQTFREGMAYTDEIIEAIDKRMSSEDKKFARAQLAFYAEYYAGVNEVYRDLYGVDLPYNPKYSPIARGDISRDTTKGFGEFGQEMVVRGSITSGSMKSRVKNIKPLENRSDVAVIQEHVSEMEHFKAWAQKVRDLNAVFGNAEVRTAIVQEKGKDILPVIDHFLNNFTRGGVERASMMKFWDKLRSRFTRGVLAAKPSIAIKQLVSFLAYAEMMPVKDFAVGLAEFAANPIAKTKFLLENSSWLRNRGENLDRDIQAATRSDAYKAFKKGQGFLNSLMMNVQIGDKGAIVMGGWALYRHAYQSARAAGKSAKEAHDIGIKTFESRSKKTQQSAALADLSKFQTMGSFAKLFSMFASSQNQYLRREIHAIRNLVAGKGTVKQHAKTLLIYHFLLPMLFQLVSDFGRWDPEEQLRAMILGSLNGLFIVGDGLDALIRSALNMKIWDAETPILSPLTKDLPKMMRLISDDDITPEDVSRALNGLMDATGKLTGLPLGYAHDVTGSAKELLSGSYLKGLGGLAGWNPYQISGGDTKKKKSETRSPFLQPKLPAPKLPSLPQPKL